MGETCFKFRGGGVGTLRMSAGITNDVLIIKSYLLLHRTIVVRESPVVVRVFAHNTGGGLSVAESRLTGWTSA